MTNVTAEKSDLDPNLIKSCQKRHEYRWMQGMARRRNSTFGPENVKKLIQDGSVDPTCAEVIIEEMSHQ
jgi:hypothetical protein